MSAPACEDIMPTVFCIMVNKAGGCELSPQAKQDCKKTCGLCGENDYEYDENGKCANSKITCLHHFIVRNLSKYRVSLHLK